MRPPHSIVFHVCKPAHYSVFLLVLQPDVEDDGMWRSHSWLLDEEGHIIETTVPRSLYYGSQIYNWLFLLNQTSLLPCDAQKNIRCLDEALAIWRINLLEF